MVHVVESNCGVVGVPARGEQRQHRAMAFAAPSLPEADAGVRAGLFRIEMMVLLCAAYVFGCAFRSILPRADVQRIALFDTWLSSVMVGRTVATIAEVCFVIQWAIVLRQLGKMGEVGYGQ